MKNTIKFFGVITGIFRSIMTILFLLGVAFTALVDSNLLVSFLDLLGFTNLSLALVKPIIILGFILLFIVNFIITRHIFKASDTGEYHLSNFVFGLLFLAITIFFYITFKSLTTSAIYILFALNGILVINSTLGLIAKTKGMYITENNKIRKDKNINNKNYIEFNESTQIDENKKSNKENKTDNIRVVSTSLSKEEKEKAIKNKNSISQNELEESNVKKETKITFESGNNNNTLDNTEEIKTDKNLTEKSQNDK